MRYKRNNIFFKYFCCFLLLFLGLMNASVTHAENYTFVTDWGSKGTGDGQFYSPSDIAIDSLGNVYVIDMELNCIQEFNRNGVFISKFGSTGTGNGQLYSPSGITFDSSGNIYVAEGLNRRIQKFDSNGNFISKFGSLGRGDGQFYEPRGVAVDSSGNIYVTDDDLDRIQKFDSTGKFITKWGSPGNGDGQFHAPRGIAIDSSGNVYVADSNNDRIQKFTSTGTFLTKWDSFTLLENPNDIAIDSSGNIYVADTYNNRIQKFTSTGTFLAKWGISYPGSIAVDSFGNVYASTSFPRCVKKFAPVKTTPTITWNNPADIIYEKALGSTQLSASASVPGTFTYTPVSGTILSAGTQTLHVDFTPTDTTNYNTASKDIEINVLKAIPTITWSNPSEIIYGTALGSTQLSASASTPGTFVYAPTAGTILSAGIHTLKVDFTPTDAANYNTTSKDVTINVLKATPTITWNNPVDIIYGTAFGDAQLDATCSVPGTFTYTPKAGTVLNAGTQTLHVDFTPTDTANYNTASTSVQINVITPVQDILQIVTMVQNLNLNQGQANSLVVKLNAATKKLNDGNKQAATNELDAFINEVEAYIKSGKLTSTEGQALIDDANNVINAINNVLDHPATSVPEFPSIALPVAAVLGLMVIVARKKQ